MRSPRKTGDLFIGFLTKQEECNIMRNKQGEMPSRHLNANDEAEPFMIHIQDVSKYYGSGESRFQVLKGISLDIQD